jgi:thiamine pyrophosphate-dependent acetolactate synthase large subunit-like protein
VIGKRIDYRLGLGGDRVFRAGSCFIQVDIHAPELGMNRRLNLGICADAKSTLRAFTERSSSRADLSGWIQHLCTLKDD